MGIFTRIITAAKIGLSGSKNGAESPAVTGNPAARFRIEQLEPRLLLSADVLPQADVAAVSQGQENPEPAIVEQLPADAAVSVSIPGGPSSASATEGQQLDIAYNGANGEILVADNQQIQRLDAITHDVIASFDIPGSDFTGALGMQILPAAIPSLGGNAVGAGSLLVTNGTASFDQVIALDANSGAQLAVLDLGQDIDPVAGAFHAGRGTLFLLDGERDRIVEVNPTDGAVINEFAAPMAIGTGGLTIHPVKGNLWIASDQSNILAELTPSGSVVNLVDGTSLGLNFNVSGLAFKNGFDLLVGTTQGDVLQIHDPRVDMPQNLSATAGTTITVPITIDNTSGIVGIDIGGFAFGGQSGISYDTAILDAASGSVHPGSIIPGGSLFIANVNDAAGTINISIALLDAAAQLSGTIALIDFQIKATTPSTTTRVDLQRISLLQDDVTPVAVIPQPVVGADETDGIITITAADTDGDGVADIVETGDGNKDGIADAQQANVATLISFTGNQPVTFVGPAGTLFKTVSAIPTPAGAPIGIDSPLGFFDWSLEGVTPGGTAVVQILLPPTINPGTYQKYGPELGNVTPHFSAFVFNGETGAQFANNVPINFDSPPVLADRITLTLRDGGRGDSDLTANGIIDDPGGPGVFVNFSIGDVIVTEGDNGSVNATFTVSLSAPSSQTVTVEAASADDSAIAGVDYTVLPTTLLTFAPGVTSQQVSVPVLGDLLDENNERFFVNLSNASNATIVDGQAQAIINDNDPLPSLSINNVTHAEGTSPDGFTNFDFTVALSQASGRTVTVDATTVSQSATAPDDYTAIPTTSLTFLPGETAKTLTVSVRHDNLFENDESFTVALSNASNAEPVPNSGEGRIINDDGPDLAITNVQAPATAVVGSQITVGWTVTNQGTQETTAEWFDYVFLSRDAVLDGGDTFIDFSASPTPLVPGASYSISHQITLAASFGVGNIDATPWYLIFATDPLIYGNSQPEIDDAANNVLAQVITFEAPDLAVTGVQAPAAASVGAFVQLEWTVTNQGAVDALAPFGWYDSVYLSQDQNFDIGLDQSILPSPGYLLNLTTPLSAGESYTLAAQNVAIPNVTPGSWYLLVVTDDNATFPFLSNLQGETNENNNVWTQAIEIGAPDLVVTNVEAPATALLGGSIPVAWTVTNQGAFDAPSFWLDGVFLSQDQNFDSGIDQLLTSAFVSNPTPLAAGASYRQPSAAPDSFFNVFVPNVATGNWYLLVVTDYQFNLQAETNENNNVWAQPLEILAPDLVVTNVQSPTSAVTNSTISLSWTVNNQGNTEAPADWYDAFYLSRDNLYDVGDILVNYRFIADETPLSAGASYTVDSQITLPSVEAGNWYLLVKADGFNYQPESNEDNNALASALEITAPDLLLTDVQAPATAVVNSAISLSWTVTNQSDVTASATWLDYVFLSRDQIYDGGDSTLYGVFAGPLAAGASYSFAPSFTVPSVEAGDWYLLVVTDAFNYQGETNESNNVWSQPLQIGAPDLVASGVQAPATAVLGSTVSVSWSVSNQGTVEAPADWYDAIYLSQDANFDGGDILLNYLLTGDKTPLGAGTSYTDPVNLPITFANNVTPGSWYLLVVADAFNYQGETNENNNVWSQPIEIGAPDLVVTNVQAPATAVVGSTVSVSWSVSNQGTVEAPADWYDAIYLSQDASYDAGDTLLNYLWTGDKTPLGAGASYSEPVNLPINLTNSVTPGIWYLLVVADAFNSQGETNENNNASAQAITLEVNEPPAGTDKIVTINEDTAYPFAAADFGFTDTNTGDSLSGVRIDSLNLPLGATLTLYGSQVTAQQVILTADIPGLLFTPVVNGNGDNYASFAFSVADSAGAFDPIANSFTFNVTAVNDAPVVNFAAYLIAENSANGAAVGTVTALDPDTGDSLSFAITSGNLSGAFLIDPTTGAITVANSAALDFETTQSYILTAQALDNGVPALGGSNSIIVNLSNVNEAPAANDDSFIIAENSANGAAVGAVTAVDPDAGTNLTYSIVGGNTGSAFAIDSATGAITVANGAALDFEPSPIFTLDINVTDNGAPQLSDAALVTINLTDVNEAPAVNGATFTLAENSANGTAVGIVTATDPDAGTTLSYTIIGGNTGGAFAIDLATGAISVANSAALDFETSPNFSLTVQASDDGVPALSGLNTVTVDLTNVNEAPIANGDSATTNEDTPVTINALANDSDPENDVLTVVAVTQGANGSVQINPDGTLQFTPNGDFNGSDSFTYQASDGNLLSNLATVSVNVNAVNDTPSFIQGADQIVAEDAGAQTVANWATNISAGPANEANQTVSFILSADNLALFSTQPFVAPNGTLTYTPALNAFGSALVTVRLQDNGGTANGGVDASAAQIFTITVSPVNDAPVAVNDSYNVDEDATLTITAPGVVTNDTDVDGDALSAALVNGPTNGVLGFNPDGSFSYTPNVNFNGSDSFSYKVNDGQADSNVATVTLTINAVNDAPSFVVGADQTVNEDSGAHAVANWATGISAGPANESDQTVSFLVSTDNPSLFAVQPAVSSDGTLTYTPAPNAFGGTLVTVRLQDSGGVTNGGVDVSEPQSFSLDVNPVNDAPLASDDSYSTDEDVPLTIAAPGALANDSDIDGDALAATVVSGPSNGVLGLNPDGSFSYTPNFNFNGSDSFSYKVNDGQLDSNIATVSVTVNAVNDAPVFVVGADQTVDEDAGPQSVPGFATDISAGPANESDQTLTFLVSADNPALFAAQPALSADGTLTYTTAANAFGSTLVTVVLQDSSGTANGGVDASAAQTFTITVSPVNDAPVAANDSYNVDEDATLTITTPGVVTNDTDVDGNTLTASQVTGPADGVLSFNPDGSFSYTANSNFNGSDSFSYKVNDGQLDSNIATVSITINAVNDAPSFVVGAAQTVNEDAGAQTVPNWATSISAGPANEADQTVSFLMSTDNPSLFAVQPAVSSDGTLSYTTALNAFGSALVTVVLQDNGGTANGGVDASAAQTFTITVSPVNDAPVAVNDSYNVDEDITLTINAAGVLGNDSDVDGNALTAVLVDGPINGVLGLNPDGSFSYTPNADYNGSDSFTYKANDGQADSNIATVSITINAVNDAPVAAGESYSTDEDTPVPLNLFANDTDIDSDSLQANVVSAPSHGTLAFGAGGSITYSPALNYNGNDSFTYQANDGQANSNIATVTITINAVNDAPLAVNDAYIVAEDSALSTRAAQGTLANDIDVEGNPLRAILVSGPSHGVAVLRADGSFIYIPTANYNGSDSFTYKTNDGLLDSAVATVAITVNGVNDAPVAKKDAYNVDEDTLLEVATQGVLANDSDIDGNPLTASLVSGPSHGSVSLNANGSFNYTPSVNYFGADSFTYRANDGVTNSAAVAVTITVKAVNDAPAALNDAYSVGEDGVLIVSNSQGVLANDSDAEGSALTAIALSTPGHGVLALRSDGSFFYVPDANFNGTDSFTYKTNDGLTDSSAATVTITVNAVNDAPVAGADSYSVDEDATLTVTGAGVLGNDSDIDGETLAATLVSGPTHGSLTLNNDGSFSYTPNANYNGADSFSYKSSDGSAQSNVVAVSIAVNSINDAPVAGNDVYLIGADGLLVIPAAQGVLANDSDADGETLQAILLTGPAHGVLVLRDDGTFVYVADEGYDGADGFIYSASDGSSAAPATVVINHRPAALNDSYSVDEDNTLTVSAPGLAGNDIDTDGDVLTAALVAGPAHGSLTLNNDGSFSYTPNTNYNGSDGFSYRVSDGFVESNIATVALTVNPVNDAPVAVNNSYSTNEDIALTITAPGVLGNDSDIEGDALAALLVTAPTHGTLSLSANGSFTYTPELNYNGSDSFTYKANDGQADSNIATVTIAINPVNDAPAAANDTHSVDEDTALTINVPGVLGNDNDVEGDALTAALVAGPAHGNLIFNNDGSFTYTPALNYNGSDSFTYKANDGQADSNIATVTIAINPINDAPVAVNENYSTDEDTALLIATAQGVLFNDGDVDGDALSAVLVSAPTHGTLSLAANGAFIYTPALNYNGSDSFTYKANDGQADSNIATVSITINPINDAPVAANDGYSTDEDTALTINVPGVLGNDIDIEGDALTAALVAGPAHGNLIFNNDGSFNYTPNANYNGGDSFTYKVNDSQADSNVATVSIAINPVNDAPVAAVDSYSVNEDAVLSIPSAQGVLANDSDVEGDALSASLVSGPAHGALALQPSGSLVYVPDVNFNGVDSFTYKANDRQADSNVATVTITVNAVNDAPAAAGDSFSVNEDTLLTVDGPGILGNDTDVDGDALQAHLITGPTHGVLALQPNGGLVYQADANYNGSDSFSYKVNDGTADSNIATVNLTIAPVNDAPVAANNSFSVDEDGALNVAAAQGVLGNDTDVEGQALQALLVSGPAHGLLALQADGAFIYQPESNFSGSDSFTYKANDGQADSNSATVSITVNPVNDAPVAIGDAFSVNEDEILTVTAAGILGNDTDADGDTLQAVLNTGPAHGALALQSNGGFVYQPDANYNGSDSFTYKMTDGTVESNLASVTLTITPVNDAPVAGANAYSLDKDSVLTVSVAQGLLGNDTDVDGDGIAAVQLTDPAHGLAVINPDGSLIYVPDAGFVGTDSLTYKATDGLLESLETVISITVEDNATITAGAQANDGTPDVFTITRNGENLEILLNGSALSTTPLAGAAQLTVKGSNDDDKLVIDFSGGNPIPSAGILFNGSGPGDEDTLEISGGAFATVTANFINGSDGSVNLDGSIISYKGLEPVLLNVGSAANMIFNLPAAAGDDAILEDDTGGVAGVSQVRSVNAVARFETTTFTNPTESLTINLAGGDTLRLSRTDLSFGPASGVTVQGDGANDTIYVVSASSGVPYAVNSAGGNDVINLGDSQDVLDGIVTVSAGAGDDVINVGDGALDNISAPVVVFGEDGTDQVFINDQAVDWGDQYSITASAVTRPFFAGMIYESVEALTLNAQSGLQTANTFNVVSTAPGMQVTINSGDGDDSIIVSSTGAGGSLNLDGTEGSDHFLVSLGSLASPVTVNDTGAAGVDRITINGTAGDDNLVLTDTGITSGIGEFVGIAGIEEVAVISDSGNDRIDGSALGIGVNLTIDAGADNDILISGAGNDSLDGGPGNDLYLILPGGADMIFDSAGIDTVDFSGAAFGITLDLRQDNGLWQILDSVGNTLAINGTIENFTGSPFDDSVTLGALADPRIVIGGLEITEIPGDTLIFDAGGNAVTSGTNSFSVNGFGVVTYSGIETPVVTNTDD